MKLRNKKTGEIREVADVIIENLKKNGSTLNAISIDEIRNEWEDYEEPKHDYYFLRDGGNIDCHWYQKLGEITERRKEIGNYFETKEEAERAVEKLKAWKRLKDKGFRFNNFVRDAIYYEINDEEIEKDIIRNDLDLLFGGEE